MKSLTITLCIAAFYWVAIPGSVYSETISAEDFDAAVEAAVADATEDLFTQSDIDAAVADATVGLYTQEQYDAASSGEAIEDLPTTEEMEALQAQIDYYIGIIKTQYDAEDQVTVEFSKKYRTYLVNGYISFQLGYDNFPKLGENYMRDEYIDNGCYVSQLLKSEDSECLDPCSAGTTGRCYYTNHGENNNKLVTDQDYEDCYNGDLELVETARAPVWRVWMMMFKEGCGENSFDQMTLSEFEQWTEEGR